MAKETASKAKASQKANSATPKKVAHSAKKGTDIGRLIKAFLIGPLKVVCVVVAAYLSLWGVSKLFMTVHAVVTAKIWPWLIGNWWILILAWIGIGISVVLYWSKDQNKKSKNKSSEPSSNNSNVPTDPKGTKGEKTPTYEESIFTKPIEGTMPETKKDLDFFAKHYDEEIERVLGRSTTPSPIFSAESVFGKVTPHENGEKKEPFKFISEG